MVALWIGFWLATTAVQIGAVCRTCKYRLTLVVFVVGMFFLWPFALVEFIDPLEK